VVLAGILAAGAAIFLYPRMNAETAWRPPEMPEDCEIFHVNAGRESVPIRIADLEKAKKKGVAIRVDGMPEGYRVFAVELIGRRLFVKLADSASGALTPEIKTVSMSGYLDGRIPAGYEVNHSKLIFEVVDEQLRPVLQVIYKRSNVVTVNGRFLNNENQPYALIFEGEAPFIFAGKSPAEVAAALERIKGKRIFKYPASAHPGELLN